LQLATSAKSATCNVLPGSPANVHASNLLVTSRAPIRCYARMQVVTCWCRPYWPVKMQAVTAAPRSKLFTRLAVLLRDIACAQSEISPTSFSLACKLFKIDAAAPRPLFDPKLHFIRKSIARPPAAIATVRCQRTCVYMYA